MNRASQSRKNRLLELLDTSDLDRISSALEPIEFTYRLPLYEAQEEIRFVYFPIAGVASLVNMMADGSASEVGTIGNEGMVGLPIILGDTVAPTSVFIQVPGEGLRLPASVFTAAFDASPTMRQTFLHYVHAFFNQVAQSAACNHIHLLNQRCARWLLMTHDRVQSDQFVLTQEFLSMMLGVRRSGVSEAAGKLREAKLIEYRRGLVTILDRKGLEAISCECYAVSKHEFDRLLGPPSGVK
jgi:CRP-like cAMP-binding protein